MECNLHHVSRLNAFILSSFAQEGIPNDCQDTRIIAITSPNSRTVLPFRYSQKTPNTHLQDETELVVRMSAIPFHINDFVPDIYRTGKLSIRRQIRTDYLGIKTEEQTLVCWVWLS